MLRSSIWRTAGSSAALQILTTVLAGVLGFLTSRTIITTFGVEAYAQYGLLVALPALMPFVDLGLAAVVVNAVAGSPDPRNDERVRRTLTSAFRLLLPSAAVIVVVAVSIEALGLWPALLGDGLMPGGERVATVCLVIFALTVPLGLGTRVLVGLGRNPLRIVLAALTSPLVLGSVLLSAQLGGGSGEWLAVFSFGATAVVFALSLVVAGALLRPQMVRAARDILHPRRAPGVRVLDTAWPMLVQLTALPVAMQSGRVLLSHVGSTEELAQYNLGSQLFNIAAGAVATAGLALWPHFTRARSEAVVASPFRACGVFAAGGLALAGGVAVLVPFLVPLVTDDAFSLPLGLSLAFVVFVVAQAVKYPLGMYMTDAAGLRFQVLPVLAMIPLSLGLAWALTDRLGAVAPVVATTLAVVLCQVVPNFYWVRRDLATRRTAAELSAISARSADL